jgi:hypothetical protein
MRNGAWGTIETVSSGNSDGYWPQVTSAAAGEAFITWQEGSRIYSKRYHSGSPVQGIDTLSAQGQYTYTSEQNSVASGSQGEAFAMWKEYSNNVRAIYANHFSGGSWGTAVKISDPNNTLSPERCMVASATPGEAFAVWTQGVGRSSEKKMFLSYFSGGQWGSPMIISDPQLADPVIYPKVASAAQLEAFFVWNQKVPSDTYHVHIRHHDPTSGWGAITVLPPLNGLRSSYGEVASGERGSAFVVWQQENAGFMRIYCSRFDGGQWSTPQVISDPGRGDHAERPCVASPSRNEAYVVWRQQSGFDHRIFCRRFSNGQWEPITEVSNPQAVSTCDFPEVASGASDEAIAIWQQFDGQAGIERIQENHRR